MSENSDEELLKEVEEELQRLVQTGELIVTVKHGEDVYSVKENRKIDGLEICIICNGDKRKTKTWCYWIQANIHCRCCHETFGGRGNVPCLKLRGIENKP